MYEPPVPLATVPAGEPRPEPPSGWARFSFDHFTETFKSAVGRGANEQVARLYYSQADDLYRHKNYAGAAAKYAAAADRLPDSTLEEDALYMQGEAWFFANEYAKANDAYGLLAKKYSEHPLHEHGRRPPICDRRVLGAVCRFQAAIRVHAEFLR